MTSHINNGATNQRAMWSDPIMLTGNTHKFSEQTSQQTRFNVMLSPYETWLSSKCQWMNHTNIQHIPTRLITVRITLSRLFSMFSKSFALRSVNSRFLSCCFSCTVFMKINWNWKIEIMLFCWDRSLYRAEFYQLRIGGWHTNVAQHIGALSLPRL